MKDLYYSCNLKGKVLCYLNVILYGLSSEVDAECININLKFKVEFVFFFCSYMFLRENDERSHLVFYYFIF